MSERLALEDELRALGRSVLTEPPPDELAEAVLARIGVGGYAPVDPSPRTGVGRSVRRRLGWAVAATVVLVLALIPPVRAAVVELLRTGGVVVRQEPAPTPPPTWPTPGSAGSTGTGTGGATAVSLARAEQLIGGHIELPSLLGPPASVAVVHEGRVAEVTWGGPTGPTRLDVFVGSLSWGYLKTAWQQVTPVSVSEHEGVWLGADHLIEWVDRAGVTHSEQPRLAGPTLVWVVPASDGDVTYRLEGPTDLTRALEVATSAR